MSSLSSASATAGGTETVEGLLRRCSLNLKSFSDGLSDTKTSVLGLTDFHDSESMHTIFADVQRLDNVLQVLNDIDGYLVSILCKLFTVAPQGTPVYEALGEFREHLRESNVASLQGRNPISLIKLGLLTNHGTCLLDLVKDKLQTFKTASNQTLTEQAEAARDAISMWSLENGKSLLQGMTDLRQLFTSAEAHGIPIPDHATQCFRFKKGLEKGIYGKFSTDV